MIVNEEWLEWLEHRAGLVRSETVAVSRLQRSLELGAEGRESMDSFGLREVRGFAGCVRIAGLGGRLSSLRGTEAATYLRSFRKKALCLLSDVAAFTAALPDGSVFFAHPDTAEDNGIKADRAVGAVVEDFFQLASSLGPEYRLCLGLSYGRMTLESCGDARWAVEGAAIPLAFELARLPEHGDSAHFSAAFGLPVADLECLPFAGALMTLCGRRLAPRPLPDPLFLDEMLARAALLLPK